MPRKPKAEPVYVYTIVQIDSPTEFDTVRSTEQLRAVFSDPRAAVDFMAHTTAHGATVVSTLNGVNGAVAAAVLAKGETLRYGRYHLGRVELRSTMFSAVTA